MSSYIPKCLIGGLALAVCFVCSAATLAAAPSTVNSDQQPSAIPSLDGMASDWLNVADVAHMPSLHNFHEMAACGPELLGVNYNPGGQLFDWPTGPRWFRYITLPLLHLKVNGAAPDCTTCRWFPYQAVRRGTTSALQIETTVRFVFEGPGLLYQVQVTNTSAHAQPVELVIDIPGAENKTASGTVVSYESDDPKLGMSHAFQETTPHAGNPEQPRLKIAHSFAQLPDDLKADSGVVTATWKRSLQPGESTTLQFVMAHNPADKAESADELAARANGWSTNFEQTWNETKTKWAQRWADMFTPGNTHFSGNLPTLVTTDEKVREIYYRSVLTVLVLHRTNLAKCNRVFITSGERAKGVVFFWDTSLWARTFALLEPKGMKQQLKLFLACDPHRGPVIDLDTGKQWDGWYAANDFTIFQLVRTYIAVTGDTAFLNESVGGQTVLEHMDALATNWQKLWRDKSVMLADYGDNENLLECAPEYVHRVPSFNAADVWMMRTMADVYRQQGNPARATELDGLANQMAQAVLGLYKPGDGVWFALHRDGTRVELRHCYDFITVGKSLTDDLSADQKREMVNFVVKELLADRWMRAMSPQDHAAPKSDRPDHGPMGAYDSWPALTVDTMCRLGAWQPAIEFLRATQAGLFEGIYGQAHEFYGDNRQNRDAPVRIAMRGACMRESVGGGAFAELIISTIFGFDPKIDSELQLYDPKIDRGIHGQLQNVRFHDQLFDITSDASGLSFKKHD
jgi:hypothetical protein